MEMVLIFIFLVVGISHDPAFEINIMGYFELQAEKKMYNETLDRKLKNTIS